MKQSKQIWQSNCTKSYFQCSLINAHYVDFRQATLYD